MENNKCLLIINPISGTLDKHGLDELVRRNLPSLEVELFMTMAHGDATVAASTAAKAHYDTVIVAGGDGTVNETAAALRGTDTKLGIIPCGSGNGLARHIGIPIDIKASIEIICKDNVTPCDYGLVNGMPFFCTFGLGFDAEVSHLFAEQKKRGFMTYVKSVVQRLKDYQSDEYTIWADGKKITEKAFIVAVCNASQYGNNAYIAPNASLTDGLLDITVVHQGNPFTTALMGIELMTGRLDKNTLIQTLRVPSAVISRNRPGVAHVDGEPVTLGERMEISCQPGLINIYTNPDYEGFKPIITPVKSFFDDINHALKRLTDKSLNNIENKN